MRASVSTVPSAAGGRCIKQSDGHRKKRLPLAFCVTPGEDESVAEGASARGQHLVERVSIVVQDIVQYTQHPPLRHHHQRVQLDPQDGASLPDDPTDLPGICCPQPAAPAHNCKKDGTGYHRLVEHPQHDVTYFEGPELPQEIESTLALLVNSLGVLGPV